MQNIIILIQFFFLFLVIFIAIFNLLYATHVNNTRHDLGVRPPKFIQKLLYINIALSFVASFVLTIFIFRV